LFGKWLIEYGLSENDILVTVDADSDQDIEMAIEKKLGLKVTYINRTLKFKCAKEKDLGFRCCLSDEKIGDQRNDNEWYKDGDILYLYKLHGVV